MKRDVVIVGGGPAGAATAMFLLRQGITPLIVEAETFPRYHIGESLTGEGGQVIRRLGLEPKMTERAWPVKYGVKVYGPTARTSWFVPVTARDENWRLQDSFTWSVRRSEFDAMMFSEARRRGAEFLPGKAIRPLVHDDGSVHGVRVQAGGGGTLDIESELLLDCSGQATFLANHRATGPKYLGAYDRQVAFFSQVTGAIRDSGEARDEKPGNTVILYQQKFHWAWFIPIDGEVTSVGIVCPSAYFLDRKESKQDFLLREIRELNPELARRIPEAHLVEDVHVIPNYSYQVRGFSGKGFLCIGDAHRFIDPIFSFGVTVAMREAEFIAPLVRAYLGNARTDNGNPFAGYQLSSERGIDVLEDMIDLFWEQPFTFAACVHRRYTDLLTDVFAGRLYEHQPSAGTLAFRKLLNRTEERERSYADGDTYSIPIGSRYHPERAPLWQVRGADVATTEHWLA
ncbi:MAG TPA: tryptophan 7-halogenase [bacterium]|nr:tryptophan 7-halogenase [bacterium]